MTAQEINYKIKERVAEDVAMHGSPQKAIAVLSEELSSYDGLWSRYSSDCLGHAITCTRLKISWLQREIANQTS